jgi:hypothetical protein
VDDPTARSSILPSPLTSLSHGGGDGPTAAPPTSDTLFLAWIARLSEPEGFFDTDNLISNESSYLHVVGALQRLGVRGGAYLGVGPDQNYSYIAQIQPRIAFIVDIRRDNLLQHLLFKALFAEATNRLHYLALLTGRPTPTDLPNWSRRPLEELLELVDSQGPSWSGVDSLMASLSERIRSFGVPLSEDDFRTIHRFHRTFIREGLDLRFTSHGRPPRFFYPTLRQLLLETDLEGRRVSYLATEEAFQSVKGLHAENRIVPVVGDLAGTHTLAEIGRALRELDVEVSAIYTSNVEFYLFGAGSFGRFAENLAGLPLSRNGVIIRSYFGRGFRAPHPQAEPGHVSTQLLQTVASLLSAQAQGGYRSYRELVTAQPIELRD